MKNEKLTDKDFTWKVFCVTSKRDPFALLGYLYGRLEQTEEGRKILADADKVIRKKNQKNA